MKTYFVIYFYNKFNLDVIYNILISFQNGFKLKNRFEFGLFMSFLFTTDTLNE